MAHRIFLHVGTPKSGTTYLQAVLWRNVEALKQAGLLLPGRFQTHYAAAKGVTSRTGQLRNTRVAVDDAWPLLADLTARWPADALIAHELLAPATPDQAAVAKAALGYDELHVIVTARQLVRQLPASWQEQVKGGLGTPYPEYVDQVCRNEARGAWFWEVQDLARIAGTWGDGIPPERVHIVTVPLSREDPDVLWQRFASVIGVDASAYPTNVPAKNVSLGVVECELLRRVHAAHDERFRDPARHQWTRKLLAIEVLGKRRGHRIALPRRSADLLAERASELAQTIRARGYHIVGDLGELTSRETDPSARTVESVTSAELADAEAWTIAQLRSQLVDRQPTTPVPEVGTGVAGILELLEHIRAADTRSAPRPARSATEPAREPARGGRRSRLAHPFRRDPA